MNYNSIKNQCVSLWTKTFDFYKEKIILYKTPDKVFVSSSANFNFAFGANSPGASLSYITQSGEFYATVEYVNEEDNNKLDYSPNDNSAYTSHGKVLLTFESGALPYFANHEKVVLDGRNFRQLSEIQPRGPFARDSFSVWCEPID